MRNSDIKKCRNSSSPEPSRFNVQPWLRTCNSAPQMKSLIVQGLKAWFDNNNNNNNNDNNNDNNNNNIIIIIMMMILKFKSLS